MDIAGDPSSDGETSDVAKSKTLPTKGKKGAATQEQSLAAGIDKKKKKKKKKKKDKPNGAAKSGDKGGAKPKHAAAADTALRFPAPPRVVTDATLDWHEYVTAVLGNDKLLHNQVLGGAVQLGWIVLIIEDTVPHMGHVSFVVRDSIRDKHDAIREFWTAAKKALTDGGNMSTPTLRKERDMLSSQIKTARTVLTAVTAGRYLFGLRPIDDLDGLSLLVQTVTSQVLRLYPVIYQYSVTETVDGDPRLVYPDFSRIRYLIKKGLALFGSALPGQMGYDETQLAAIEWYPELVRLPEQAAAHMRAQLRPGGVLARRLAEPHVYDLDAEKQLRALDLANPDTFAAVERAFLEMRDMTGGAAGPLPPRPARLLPHTGQSLVDAYWSRLGAMLFAMDLICMTPASPIFIDTMQNFKFDCLNGMLFDSVIDLQLAQWRWLYPRWELDVVWRPAFRCAADLDLMTACLDRADVVLKDTHECMALLYRTMKKHVKEHSQDAKLGINVHFVGDGCGKNTGTASENDGDRRRHANDVANRRVLRVVNMLSRMGLRTGVAMSYIIESHHVLPAYLIFIQDYKIQPSKSAWQIVERMFEDIVKVAHTADDSEECMVDQVMSEFCVSGPDNKYPSPRQLGNREANTREFLLAACDELAKRVIAQMRKKERPMMPEVLEKMLAMTSDALLFNVEEPNYKYSRSGSGPPRQLLQHLAVDWSATLTSAASSTSDWRRCVPDPEAAAGALKRIGRPVQLSTVAEESCMVGAGDGKTPPNGCLHRGPDRLACYVQKTLRQISFTEHVLRNVSPSWEISVHRTVSNVLRECWLPYLLCADRVFRDKTACDQLYSQHTYTIDDCSDWLETNLTNLYRSRRDIGPGRMLRLDRSWMTADAMLRPDITLCRTISWMQACDLHMDMMRRLMKTLWFLRTRLPPFVEDGCEVHPAPLELLERVETGAVLLVAAFLDYREGREARHLVDVSELDDQVALALDLHGWLGLLYELVAYSPAGQQQPESEGQTEDLLAVTERAFTSYERSLRHGSLLEFLALRSAYAVPLQLVVAANLRRDKQSLAALRRGVDEPVMTLPPLSELRSRAARDHALPMEWMVRLQQLRRVLLSTSRPFLLDSTLVCLDYQLECTADQLPDLPTFDGPQNMSDSGMFTVGCEVDAEALCNHLFDLGQHVLKYQTAMKTSFYLAQNDHIFPDRRFFITPSGMSGATKPQPSAPVDRDGGRSDITKWASEHVVKRQLQRTTRRGQQQQQSGDPDTATQEEKSETQLATIERLSQELEGLLLSADHLKDIPEEPLKPSLLEWVGRRAQRLSDGAQRLPDGALRASAGRLIDSVQRAVARPQPRRRGRRKARTIAGSEMSVVDTCLSMLSSVLSQHGLAVTEDSSAPESESESEAEAEAAGAVAALRICSFCDGREKTPGTFELCSLCVAEGESEPRSYCGKACQTDDWEVSHWEDHN